jgi:hypothetical protein
MQNGGVSHNFIASDLAQKHARKLQAIDALSVLFWYQISSIKINFVTEM